MPSVMRGWTGGSDAKAADRSKRMRTDDLESAFAICKASVTESCAVSVECLCLNPDWLGVFAMNGRRETGL